MESLEGHSLPKPPSLRVRMFAFPHQSQVKSVKYVNTTQSPASLFILHKQPLCGDLNEQLPPLPHRLTWSPVGGAVWGGSGCGALLEKERPCRWALRACSLALLTGPSFCFMFAVEMGSFSFLLQLPADMPIPLLWTFPMDP